MALKLDRPFHLAAGVAATDISDRAADVTGRIRGADLADERPRLLGKFEGLTPGMEIILAEHDAPSQ